MALCGTSGSGKTTLISMLSGLDEPSSGIIELNQSPFYQFSLQDKSQFRSQYMSLIFQQVTLIPYLNIKENLLLPQLYANVEINMTLISEQLENMSLSHLLTHKPHELSVGQAQRICVLRALGTNPKIILADEPTGALDPPNAKYIFELLKSYCKKNQASCLIATHDWQLAKKCDLQLWLTQESGHVN